MRSRLALGHFLLRLGKLIESLAVVAMRPDDLVEFSRQTYARARTIEEFGEEEHVARGLAPEEIALLDMVPVQQGRLLVLGVGGGREALALAQMGFEVVGLDHVPEMVERAKKNAARYGVNLEVLVQEFSQLEVPPGSFDLALMVNGMYSASPTRKRRIEILQRIHQALKPGAYFLCEFAFNNQLKLYPLVEAGKKVFAYITWGNLEYEQGDRITIVGEFLHCFVSEQELLGEFKAGGFEVVFLDIRKNISEAVLRRREVNSG